jgi:hypothetical protein
MIATRFFCCFVMQNPARVWHNTGEEMAGHDFMTPYGKKK